MKNIDIHAVAQDLIEHLERSYYDREGRRRGREKKIFNIDEVIIAEKYLRKLAKESSRDNDED